MWAQIPVPSWFRWFRTLQLRALSVFPCPLLPPSLLRILGTSPPPLQEGLSLIQGSSWTEKVLVKNGRKESRLMAGVSSGAGVGLMALTALGDGPSW